MEKETGWHTLFKLASTEPQDCLHTCHPCNKRSCFLVRELESDGPNSSLVGICPKPIVNTTKGISLNLSIII